MYCKKSAGLPWRKNDPMTDAEKLRAAQELKRLTIGLKLLHNVLSLPKMPKLEPKHKFLTAGDISNNNCLFVGSVIVWSFLLPGADIELLVRYC